MTNSDFKAKLLKQLSLLPRERVIDFGLNICYRLLPEYIIFSNKNTWGNIFALEESIAFCERNKSNLAVDKIELNDLISIVTKAIPDTEDYGDWDGSYALNASASVAELLDYFSDQNMVHILNISTYMLDTIDFKIHEERNNLSPQQLELHPLIIAEEQHQIEIIMTVDKGKTLEQLDKQDFGTPEYDSHLVKTVHLLRKKPLKDFTLENLRIMIGQNINLEILIPIAIEKLQINILAEGDFYPGDLLNSVLNSDSNYWIKNREKWSKIKNLYTENRELFGTDNTYKLIQKSFQRFEKI